MLEYYTGKGLAWKWSEPLGPGGGGASEYRNSFRRQGITQKKAYNIQYMAKV